MNSDPADFNDENDGELPETPLDEFATPPPADEFATRPSSDPLPPLSSAADSLETIEPPNSGRPPDNSFAGHTPNDHVDQRARIGPYKILQKIAEGGMGAVYMAEQEKPVRRRVALKVIKAGRDSQQIIVRFEAERQALAMMNHPNIAKVLDVGAADNGSPYFAMELVKGIPLTEYCDQHKLSIRERLELFVPVCKAVQHAHQKGIIHRDLKPSNVLVALYDGFPVPKVIDFGLAKATQHQTRLTDKTMFTEYGAVVGTLQYMSPEQAEMNQLDVDTRTDVYSLGVMLYELLTGSTPLDEDTMGQHALLKVLEIIREKEPAKPSTRLSESGEAIMGVSDQRKIQSARLQQILRGELDWIVMKSLEKDRTRRYDTATAFADDITRFLNDEPVEAKPASRGYKFQKFARKNKGLVAAIATISILLAGGAIGTSYGLYRAQQKTSETQQQKKVADQKTVEARQQQARAEETALSLREQVTKTESARREVELERNAAYTNLYYADMRLGVMDLHSSNIARLQSTLARHLPAKDRTDMRGWEWYYLYGLCHNELTTLSTSIRSALSVAWSPDGRYIAACGDKPMGLHIWDTTNWKSLRTFSEFQAGLLRGTEWSPDSNRLAWASIDRGYPIRIWDSQTDRVVSLYGHEFSIASIKWSPDGKRLASASYDDTVRIWNAGDGTCTNVLRCKGNLNSVDWSPNSQLLAIGGNYLDGLQVWDADTATIVSEPLKATIACVDWSPDGDRLAVAASTNSWNSCLIFDTDNWELEKKFPNQIGRVRCIAWNPDGIRFATAGADGLIKLWDKSLPDAQTTLHGHRKQILSLAWNPQGERLVSAGEDGEVKVWPVSTRPQPRRPVINQHIQTISWAQEPGLLIVAGASDGRVTLWESSTGKQRVEQRTGTGIPGGLSPDRQQSVVIAQSDGQTSVQIIDTTKGETVTTLDANFDTLEQVAWSHDGLRMAIYGKYSVAEKLPHEAEISANLQVQKAIEIWDVANHKRSCRADLVDVDAFAWNPAGNLLALAGKGIPSEWISKDGRDYKGGTHVAWVYVFDPSTGIPIKVQRGTRFVKATAVCWSPDGRWIASGDGNGTVELHEVSRDAGKRSISISEQQIRFEPHSAAIVDLAWSPDGRRIVTAGKDAKIKILESQTGEEILSFDVESNAKMVRWSPEGSKLSVLTDDGIQIWDAAAGYDSMANKDISVE